MNIEKMTNAQFEAWKEMSWFDKCIAIAPVQFSIILAGTLGSVIFIGLELAYSFGLIF
jgi:hypothetical protein